MPLININLIQQQQVRKAHAQQANMVVTGVVGAIVGLQLLVAVFLFATAAIRANEKRGLEDEKARLSGQIAELDKVKSDIYPGMTLTQQAKAYQGQIDAAKQLVENHKYFTLYLSEITVNTPPTITYSSFNSDTNNKLLVSGTADAYADVSKLTDTLGKLSFTKSASIQDARLDTSKVGQGRAVTFTITVELKSAGELKKLPQTRSSTAPAPSASPASTAAPASLGGTR